MINKSSVKHGFNLVYKEKDCTGTEALAHIQRAYIIVMKCLHWVVMETRGEP